MCVTITSKLVLMMLLTVARSDISFTAINSTKDGENVTLLCIAEDDDFTFTFKSQASNTSFTIAECLVMAKQCFLHPISHLDIDNTDYSTDSTEVKVTYTSPIAGTTVAIVTLLVISIILMGWMKHRRKRNQNGEDEEILLNRTDHPPCFVGAIDIGTINLGWAFSSKDDNTIDPTKITTMKLPTNVLIRPDGVTLDSMGSEAAIHYRDLSENETHKPWYYFCGINMVHSPINEDTMLTGEYGRSLPALTVIPSIIGYMMQDLISVARQQHIGLDKNDILWVLTVSAILDESTKHFLRLAAQKAGIVPEKLRLVLSPEAASVYYKQLPVQKDEQSGVSAFRQGTKYMVVDAGGGTIDIAVHEVCRGGELKELYPPTGGLWGGTMVDTAILDFFMKLIGMEALKQFKELYMEDYIEFNRQLETRKRETDFTSNGRMTIRLAMSFIRLVHQFRGQSLEHIIQSSHYSCKISLVDDKLRLDNDIFRSFLMSSVDRILQHISELLQKPANSGVETIIVAGGYSNSPFLQEAFRHRFPELNIFVPSDISIAVLKGAVLYGHNPTTIQQRDCQS